MSYDTVIAEEVEFQGIVSIPLEQGNVLRRKLTPEHVVKGLNPFGTGQCLTTKLKKLGKYKNWSLNPFGTGQCLTTNPYVVQFYCQESQSLWNRAISYDVKE